MQQRIKTTRDLHVQRKLFHFISVFCIFLATVYLKPWLCLTLYILVTPFGIMIDVVRQSSRQFNRSVIKVMGPILRKTEIRNLSGATFAALGVGLAYFLYSFPAAQLAILFLAIGDPIASYFGVKMGKHKLLGKKSWEGSIAAFLACSIASLLFFKFSPWTIADPALWVTYSFACGVIGAVGELIPIGKLDDNLSQPMISGFLLTVLFATTGVF